MTRNYGRIELGSRDPELYIPANPPIVPFRNDSRPPERSVFPQGEELSFATHCRTQSEFDPKTGTLTVRWHRNRPDWSDLKYAAAHFRSEGHVIRRIEAHMHCDVFRDYYPELQFYKLAERDEGLERSASGEFVTVRHMKPPKVNPEAKGAVKEAGAE